jgi:nucleoside-diphosphate-sugar epimerase
MADFNLLISGTASGLGNAFHRTLGGTPLVRGMSLDDPLIRATQPFDAIIHCAVNTKKPVMMSHAFDYLDDNLLLTQRLLEIPHKRFVYISTLNVYPRLSRPIAEDEDVDLSSLSGPYAFTKLFSELLVREHSDSYLILRLATLLGPVMRPTVTRRLLTEKWCQVGLSAESRYNYILQSDVVAFVRLALYTDLSGTYNLASREAVTLSDMARQLNLATTFGTKYYDIGPINSMRAAGLMPAFARESWQTINLFIDTLGPAFVGSGRMCGETRRC